jgi:hypothetical protein
MSEIYTNASRSVIIDDENSITFTTKKKHIKEEDERQRQTFGQQKKNYKANRLE